MKLPKAAACRGLPGPAGQQLGPQHPCMRPETERLWGSCSLEWGEARLSELSDIAGARPLYHLRPCWACSREAVQGTAWARETFHRQRKRRPWPWKNQHQGHLEAQARPWSSSHGASCTGRAGALRHLEQTRQLVPE